MQLKPVDSPEMLQLVVGWLSQKENYQWLDFGDGRQLVSPEWLKIAMQRGTYVLRVFTADDDVPIGVTGLTNVNPHFKTANVWVVLGDDRYAGRSYATRGISAMLTLGFRELGLAAIHTWIVDGNPSVHVARKVNFKPIGRQRRLSTSTAVPRTRLWFDLLATEHQEIPDVRRQHIA